MCIFKFGFFILKIVVIKLIVLRIFEVFDKWRLKIVKFIVLLEWFVIWFNGGYIVYLVLIFILIKVLFKRSKSEGGNN